ncbi:hypothetical protein BHU72_04785 [Desulfuribacillus stibiiarsenatis]|uniref:Rhodanese domain-containing protein n=1 Tax=Desulfuribacillus stibiiarsenatis TaxID=1390249 RepID=A0A1E5L602_9FIRM|nr:rhodanese-like domain-containing protein [Desulfuribacillus stibiiarsenatis]OEH85409.1 hypothetical protein BHU72_04785 [Desulfuribacillus stibiiarsenatis]
MIINKRWHITSVLAVMLVFAMLLVGCSSTASVAVREYQVPSLPLDPPVYEGVKAPDGMSNAVPVEPHLNYIETFELMNLYLKGKPVSNERDSYEQYAKDWEFVIVDSRPPAKYNEAHINGAINIPDAEFDKFANRLPEDKSKLLIFYCNGWDCPLSPSSANKAIKLGYTNVRVYQEGVAGWKSAGNYFATTPQHVASRITDDYVSGTASGAKAFRIIDARPYASYFQAHVPTSFPLDDGIFSKNSKSFPLDKNTEIIFYCGGFYCSKSHNEARLLSTLGYTDVKVMVGGLPEWKKAGLPTFGTESSGVKFDISGGKANLALTPEEWKKKYDAGKVVVVDVRTADERSAGAIPNSIHLVDKDILANPKIISEKLPADKNVTVLIHCASGARASGVASKFTDEGYKNSFYLNSKITIKADGTFGF